MPLEPPVRRTVAFVDGQNLFYSAKLAFGHGYPNFDVVKLARKVCNARGWALAETRFYTGVPDRSDNPFWNHFWNAKLPQMGREGVVTFQRALRYRNQTVTLPDGRQHTFLVGQEKGIDIRIALDSSVWRTGGPTTWRWCSARTRTSARRPMSCARLLASRAAG